jgi:phage terminase small subunit
MAELGDKQRRFAQEYLVDCNATQAAIRAGYSAKTAYSQGQRLLKHVEVKALIAAGQQKRADRTEITAERVLRELGILGFSDMRHYIRFTEGGDLVLDWSEMPAEATRAIAEITQEEYMDGKGDDARPVKRTRFKLHPKTQALELIGKHLRMFVEKTEGTVQHTHTFEALVKDLKGNERHVKSLREYYALTAIASGPAPDGPAD